MLNEFNHFQKKSRLVIARYDVELSSFKYNIEVQYLERKDRPFRCYREKQMKKAYELRPLKAPKIHLPPKFKIRPLTYNYYDDILNIPIYYTDPIPEMYDLRKWWEKEPVIVEWEEPPPTSEDVPVIDNGETYYIDRDLVAYIPRPPPKQKSDFERMLESFRRKR